MDIIFSDIEKDIFRKLQNLKGSFVKKSLSSHAIEKLFIKHIILNRFARLQIDPTIGQFDAFVDEIEAYLDKSVDAFTSFLKENKITEESDKKSK